MIGLRVLRSSDWERGDEDGGEGHLGTVATDCGDGTADVIWDNGRRSRCNVGKGGKCELLIFDNAPVGVRHMEMTCDGCDQRGIRGMRWKCVTCSNFNLCPVCYVRGKHELTHEFIRYTTPGSDGVKVKKRSTCQRIQSTGIFPGATVERGQDWKWEDQDGGAGSRGKVVSVENSSGDSAARNVVRVRWDKGGSNIYRVGANGKMDLKFVDEFPGTYYYKDHLPVITQCVEGKNKVENVTETETEILNEDDMVYIKLSAEVLKLKQKESAGWTNQMADCIGKTGVIKGFTPTGDAMVEFEGLRFRLFPGALQKVRALSVGEVVRISSDEEMVKVMQSQTGGRMQNISKVLGKCGRVVKVDPDGDVAVAFGEKLYEFNPACCTPAPGKSVDDISSTNTDSGNGSSTEDSPTSSTEGRSKDMNDQLLKLLASLLVQKHDSGDTANSDILYLAIAKGNADLVKSIIRNQPSLVNARHKDATPLIIASREGEEEIVKILLQNNAHKEATDDKGNTPLCYALNGKKEGVAKILLENGAKANVANSNGRTPLHFAAWDNLSDIMRPLIEQGCPVNAQDKSGDTALHDCVQKGHRKCVDVMCRAGKLDLSVTNKKGFTPLQLAALRDNVHAVKRILMRDDSTANAHKTEDFYTALHIAAVNDHVDCARILIAEGNAKLDAKDKRGVTPLHLACHEAYYNTVEFLLEKGATVDIQDDGGNTPLHLAVAVSKKKKTLDSLIGHSSSDDNEVRVRIACLLIEKGASPDIYNNQGDTPLEAAKNSKIRRGVQLYIDSKGKQKPQARHGEVNQVINQNITCIKCLERISDITVKPCGHKVLCRACCLQVESCPVCEKFIERRIDQSSNEEVDKSCKVQ